ncbi:MAG: hypothetical protein ACO3JL_06690 [Myxococcota bacterium]
MTRIVVAMVLLASSAGGCAYTVTARSDHAGELIVDDKPPQRVRVGENDVEVPVTLSNPTWQLFASDEAIAAGAAPLAEGEFLRSRLAPLPTTSICTASACFSPVCAGAGFCLANPGAAVGCLAPANSSFLVFGLNALVTSLDNPSWSTLPAMAACTMCGLAPLALLPFVLRVPDELELELPPLGEHSGSAAAGSPVEQPY